jgi:hypothetical protein
VDGGEVTFEDDCLVCERAVVGGHGEENFLAGLDLDSLPGKETEVGDGASTRRVSRVFRYLYASKDDVSLLTCAMAAKAKCALYAKDRGNGGGLNSC